MTNIGRIMPNIYFIIIINIFDLIKNRNKKGYVPIKEVLIETFAQIERLYNQKDAVTGIPTGFIDLDNKTAGLHGSELILVAARPAMGKTAFALNIASNAAIRANAPVAIFSLEMSKEQLVSRILASETLIDSNKLRTGKMEEEDLIKLSEGLRTSIGIRNIYRRYSRNFNNRY